MKELSFLIIPKVVDHVATSIYTHYLQQSVILFLSAGAVSPLGRMRLWLICLPSLLLLTQLPVGWVCYWSWSELLSATQDRKCHWLVYFGCFSLLNSHGSAVASCFLSSGIHWKVHLEGRHSWVEGPPQVLCNPLCVTNSFRSPVPICNHVSQLTPLAILSQPLDEPVPDEAPLPLTIVSQTLQNAIFTSFTTQGRYYPEQCDICDLKGK